MPKLKRRTSRYDQLQALLYGPVGDLLALGRGLDIPIADLRAAIRYQ